MPSAVTTSSPSSDCFSVCVCVCVCVLAELQLHRQRVDVHCEEVLDILTSCRVELQKLQTSISRRNQEFTVTVSNMEEDVLTADSSQR